MNTIFTIILMILGVTVITGLIIGLETKSEDERRKRLQEKIERYCK